jgi:hypothetical protein
MRKGMIACLAFAIVSGAMSVKLWLDLRHEREVNAALVARLGGAPVESAPANPPIHASSSSASSAPPAGVAQAGAAPPPSDPQDAEDADRAYVERRRAMLADPQYRMNFLSSARLRISMESPGLTDALRLTPDEATRLFDILAQRELDRQGIDLLVADMPEERSLDARVEAFEEINRRRDDALAALLGSARLAQYDAYREQQPGLRQVADLNQLFAASGVPLATGQSAKMAAMLSEEQAWLRAEADRLLPRRVLRVDGASAAQLMEQAALLAAEGNRRKLQRARDLLSDRQLQVLKDSLDKKLAEARADAAAARGIAGTKQAAP